MLLRKTRFIATGILALLLSLVGCTGGGSTNGGTASGGTSGGGATEVGPSTPVGSKIFLDVEGSPCVPSKSGTVTISGRGATPHDTFEVQVYYPFGSGKELIPGKRPGFNRSALVSKDGTFSWSFGCGKYPTGQYEVHFSYDGSIVKKEAFDVTQPRG